jgi:RimJ/RimL family protein N-acetyltransferase
MASPTSEPGWIVRHATLEDLEPALDVLATVAEERIYIGSEPPIDRERRLGRWRAIFEHPKETMMVVVADGRVVGNGDIQWAGVSEVGMALLPEWRGRGAGTALLDALISWAETEGSHKAELRVWPHNEAAIALYERFGFEREGYLKRHYRRSSGELWDCIIMGLQLPRPA